MVTAQDLVAEVERRGARLTLRGERLHASGASAIPQKLRAAIGEHKAEIVELLRGEIRASEWDIVPCQSFTVLIGTDEEVAAQRGCCIRCGVPVESHGNPEPALWARVSSLDDVELVAPKFVLAKAQAIARAARS